MLMSQVDPRAVRDLILMSQVLRFLDFFYLDPLIVCSKKKLLIFVLFALLHTL